MPRGCWAVALTMRVLLTSESYLPYVSGVTVSVDALARSLGARGHEVLVLAPRPAAGEAVQPVGTPGPAPRHAWLPSYQLPWIAPDGYRMPWPVPWSRAVAMATAFRPHVVHAHSPFLTGLLARGIASASDAPLVFTHHTRFGDYGHYVGAFARPAARVTDAYLRAFWGACAAVVAPSTDLADEIRARLPDARRARVHVVPTGVHVPGLAAIEPVDSRAEAGWPPESIVAVSLGRLAPEKSPMTVLDAVAVAAREAPALRLLVIGGGPSERTLRQRAQAADLSGLVHFTGSLPRPIALARAAGGDVFAFASRTETQGLVLAEALSLGLPAVALEGPGVRDSVRDGVDGLVLPADPPASRAERLGSAIASVAREPHRLQTLAMAARRDAPRFSVDRRAAEMEAMYRTVVGAP